jgi:hypothetical protein
MNYPLFYVEVVDAVVALRVLSGARARHYWLLIWLGSNPELSVLT